MKRERFAGSPPPEAEAKAISGNERVLSGSKWNWLIGECECSPRVKGTKEKEKGEMTNSGESYGSVGKGVFQRNSSAKGKVKPNYDRRKYNTSSWNADDPGYHSSIAEIATLRETDCAGKKEIPAQSFPATRLYHT